jgi:hypothetical protein
VGPVEDDFTTVHGDIEVADDKLTTWSGKRFYGAISRFRRRHSFKLTTAGQPDRTYTSIASARRWERRVWGGMHYPSTVAISDALGEAIAKYVNRNASRDSAAGDDGS